MTLRDTIIFLDPFLNNHLDLLGNAVRNNDIEYLNYWLKSNLVLNDSYDADDNAYNIQVINNTLNQLLMYATSYGYPKVAEKLVEFGANINCFDYDQNTPLTLASRRLFKAVRQNESSEVERYKNLLKVLTRNNANLGETQDKDIIIKNYIDYAIKANDMELLYYCVQQDPGIINSPLYENYTPLMYSIVIGAENATEKLIELGADLNEKHGIILALETLFERSRQDNLDKFKSFKKIVNLLLEKGIDLEDIPCKEIVIKDRIADSIEDNDIESLKYWITKYPDLLNLGLVETWTPLMWVIEKGSKEAAEALIELGANVDLLTDDNKTPLSLAAAKGKLDWIDFLLSKDANIEKVNFYGYTSLVIAAKNGKIESVIKLLMAGAEVDVQSSWGYTAAMIAAGEGYADILLLLLENGADIDKKGSEGINVIFSAVSNPQSSKVLAEFLLKQDGGASSNLSDQAKKFLDEYMSIYPTLVYGINGTVESEILLLGELVDTSSSEMDISWE